METGQFVFEDLDWMGSGHVEFVRAQLKNLDKYGIKWCFMTDSAGTRLMLSGFDGELKGENAMPEETKHWSFYKNCEIVHRHENEAVTRETVLIILTIDSDMCCSYKIIRADGFSYYK